MALQGRNPGEYLDMDLACELDHRAIYQDRHGVTPCSGLISRLCAEHIAALTVRNYCGLRTEPGGASRQ